MKYLIFKHPRFGVKTYVPVPNDAKLYRVPPEKHRPFRVINWSQADIEDMVVNQADAIRKYNETVYHPGVGYVGNTPDRDAELNKPKEETKTTV